MPIPNSLSPQAKASQKYVDAAFCWTRQQESALGVEFVDKTIQRVEMMQPWTRVKDWTNWHVNTFLNSCLNHIDTLPQVRNRQGVIDGISAMPFTSTAPVSEGTEPADGAPETPAG